MKKRMLLIMIVVMAALIVAGCSPSAPTPQTKEPVVKKEILVSTAASLANAMTEMEKAFEDKNPGVDLNFTYGSSGSLQTQIEQGAPADIFLSAGKSQVDALEQKNLLLADTRVNFTANDLVLVVGAKNTTINSFEDIVKADKVSIGTPESVPAGKYAKESLTSLKLWDELESKSKFVLAKDVTQVLTYVESENVDAGLVYGSDAYGSTKVRIVAKAPSDSHSAIIYPGAVIAASKNPTEAKAFMQFVTSAEGQAILVKYGFKEMK